MKLPQLSLRELFLLVALVAMGCGWWVERERLLNQRDEYRFRAFVSADQHWSHLDSLREYLKDLGCEVEWTNERFSVRSPSGTEGLGAPLGMGFENPPPPDGPID